MFNRLEFIYIILSVCGTLASQIKLIYVFTFMQDQKQISIPKPGK